MSKEAETGARLFEAGFSCSQAVLAAHCEDYGLERSLALKVAGAFGGGMGHIGETCGAVSGALMLLGLKYGKHTVEDSVSKEKTYAYVKAFTDRFKARHGSIHCNELVGYDLGNPEELIKARESDVFKTVCPRLVRSAIESVETLLAGELPEQA